MGSLKKASTSALIRPLISVVVLTLSIFLTYSDAGSSSSLNSSPSSSSFIYSSGRGKSNKKDLSSAFGASVGQQLTQAGSASSLASTAYVEPRGDTSYGGGGFGSSGGGYGGGGGGGGYGGAGGPSVYHYAIQPHGGGGGGGGGGWGGGGGGGGWGHAPVYYEEEGGGFGEKGLLGLIGLSGLGGLKGLLGLAALAKLLLPLLALLLPLLLPLLLAKAALLFALLLLIPIPVITTGRNILKDGQGTGKVLLQETISELMSKLPSDVTQIISKIKDSDFFKPKGKEAMKTKPYKDAMKPELRDNIVKNTR